MFIIVVVVVMILLLDYMDGVFWLPLALAFVLFCRTWSLDKRNW